MYYNTALIGLEVNFSSYPTTKLDELKYPKLYVREKQDEYTGRLEKKLGFKTTQVTRPLILAELQRIVLENIDKINDKDTLEEMLTFVRNEKGRPEAQNGSHDDQIMGLAITFYIREQQSFRLFPKEIPKMVERDYRDFGVKKIISNNEDIGSKIEIV